MNPSENISRMTRQEFMRLLGAGAGAVALGEYGIAHATDLGYAGLTSRAVRNFALNPGPAQVWLGRQRASTIAYNGTIPGPEIRLKKGERMRALVTNHLSSSTSVHWHGMPIPNGMDGVPGLTQSPINPGQTFLYDWKAPVSGTYWYHSHSGIQNDRGLYGPLIIEPKRETLSYDREYTLMMDDWIDGIQRWSGHTSDYVYACHLVPQSADGADPKLVGPTPPAQPTYYPLFLINGKPGTDPMTFYVKKGDVVRLRLINASAATTVRVAIAGHRMRVVASDGQPVEPVDVDVLEIGMAERYDVLVYATNPGIWQIGVTVNGEGMRTRAILQYQGVHGKAPPANLKPKTFGGRLLDYGMLKASAHVDYQVPHDKPDLVIPIGLNARYGSFWMTFNGQVLSSDQPLHIPRDKHIRFVISNSGSTEVHPIHLHGQAFQVMNGTGRGPMKDTIKVYPFQTVTLDWISSNPGKWMLHCHNLYHMLGGMMQILHVK